MASARASTSPASTSEPEEAPPEPAAAPDSPRASVREFFALCSEGSYIEAARFLDVNDPTSLEAPILARRLKAVLDRYAWVDLDLLSPESLGDTGDKLPSGVDEIAKVPGPGGKMEGVRIVRRLLPETGIRWVFTRPTVERINVWYGRLKDRWFLENMPEPLLRSGPKDLLYWQWLALPILVFFVWLIGRALGFLTHRVLSRVVEKTSGSWDDDLLRGLRMPIAVGWTLAGLYLVIPLLGVYAPGEEFLNKLLKAVFFIVLFWSIMRCIEVIGSVLLHLGKDRDLPGTRSLVPLISSLGKIVVLAMGLIAVLSEFGYPVASLIAGLGIGGIILALAAQKTVENLFGSISIGLDKPFRVGDFVKIEDFLGTIERIGLRSTRIRTLDRTLITIPNGRLADMRVESFTSRDRMRLFAVLGLVYGTTAAQMREVRAGLEEVLRAHPKIWKDDITVRFRALGTSSLDIEVMAWFETTSSPEFLAIREEVLLSFMEVVERAGTKFALPTQTVHVVREREGGDPAANATA